MDLQPTPALTYLNLNYMGTPDDSPGSDQCGYCDGS